MAKKKPEIKNNWLNDPKLLRILVTVSSAAFILTGAILAVQVAKGYRPSRDGSILAGTGILNVNSVPRNSLVYINGVLQDKVTDDQINLEPGEYEVEIRQEGFSSWIKKLLVGKELVTSTNAHLFKSVPSLTPQTFSGAVNITPSPDGRKLAYAIASPSAKVKAGLYVMELTDRPGLFSRNANLIAESGSRFDFKKAKVLWSPDSGQLVASFESGVSLLLDPSESLSSIELVDASTQLEVLLPAWEAEIADREKQLLVELPDQVFDTVSSSATNLYFSPDGSKLLYTATKEAVIPDNLINQQPASSTQEQQRTIRPGHLYVYDIKEDRNFLIRAGVENLTEAGAPQKVKLVRDLSSSGLFAGASASDSATLLLAGEESFFETINNFKAQYSSFPFYSYQWFPTSSHILLNEGGVVSVVEYDGTNGTTLYQGQFEDGFVYPWPDGSKLLILANLTSNPNLPANVYSINLR